VFGEECEVDLLESGDDVGDVVFAETVRGWRSTVVDHRVHVSVVGLNPCEDGMLAGFQLVLKLFDVVVDFRLVDLEFPGWREGDLNRILSVYLVILKL
jgi:hypothetical protein